MLKQLVFVQCLFPYRQDLAISFFSLFFSRLVIVPINLSRLISSHHSRSFFLNPYLITPI